MDEQSAIPTKFDVFGSNNADCTDVSYLYNSKMISQIY